MYDANIMKNLKKKEKIESNVIIKKFMNFIVFNGCTTRICDSILNGI